MKMLRNIKGVTLAEMIIVMAIVGIIFAIGSNTYRGQREVVEFNNSLTEVIGMMKTARNYAITSRQVNDDSQPAGQELYIPEEGYGIYFEQSSTPGISKVILFANTSTTSPDAKVNQYDDDSTNPDDITEVEYILPDNTNFEGIYSDKGITSEGDRAVIIFKPPLADTYIATNDAPAGSTFSYSEIDTLYLKFSRAGAPDDADKYIKINKTAGFPELELN